MDVKKILDRVNEIPEFTGKAGLSATWQEAVANTKTDDCLWVCNIVGTVEQEKGVYAIQQWHKTEFTVLIGTKHYGDATGGAASERMLALRLLVNQKLLGWAHDTHYTPFRAVKDGIAAWVENQLYWADVYRTYHLL